MAEDYALRVTSLRLHEIEWHRKLTLSVACLVLFLIGAPLGSIIRKGGLGTPWYLPSSFLSSFTYSTLLEKNLSSQMLPLH